MREVTTTRGNCTIMNIYYDLETVKNHEYRLLNTILNDRLYGNDLSFEKIITYILLRLRCSSNLLGYRYLKIGIELVLAEPDLAMNVLKELYPSIANISKRRYVHKIDPTIDSVEHALRTAIKKIWMNNNINKNMILSVLFGEVYTNLQTPSNGDFITTVADYIRLVYITEE